jgi:hypothetical protein
MVLSFFFALVAISSANSSVKEHQGVGVIFWSLVACALFSLGLDLAGV